MIEQTRTVPSSDPHRENNSKNLPAFEKTRLIMSDRVTNDTDNALISSEDENEAVKSVASLNSQTGGTAPPKPPRRSSFLSEIQPDNKRKMSFSSFPAPSSGSQPPTPSADNTANPWTIGTGLTRVTSNGSSTAWSAVNSIWKDVPIGQPLTPTRSLGESRSPIGAIDPLEDIIPFSIPLHPTPKTYRSQSYSVGQMEAELANSRANASAIKHKPSKLNEVEHAPTLDEVHEGDDEGSDAGVPLGSPRLYNSQPFTSLAHANSSHAREEFDDTILNRRQRLSVAESPTGLTLRPIDSARSDAPVSMDEATKQSLGSHIGGAMAINANRPQWQSSLKFDHTRDTSASRRHSLADVPTRRGSFAADAHPHEQNPGAYMDQLEGDSRFQKNMADLEDTIIQNDMHNRAYAQNYFSGTAPANRSRIESAQGYPEVPDYRGLTGQHRQGPPAGVFTRPGYDTPLYIVAFKCARADIYYVQPGTGLEVNEGDLVMVEADRGYDLGTVTHARVSWTRARELKEKALDEHFRWLMMFSRHNQDVAASDPQAMHGLMAQKGPRERDPLRKARESFGNGMHDAQFNHDIKPRMIKRRAFNHEIANLREKEGNEAKAKRSCQQKAREHGCQMEILDAEFQIDWKKLTFYFYAEDYVNFNALVTDLYKVYKVRIWMSAINPNTYPSPATKPPSSIGPGAMEGRDTPMDQSVAAYNDPDPDGALPPSLNPNSATYKELHKEASVHGYGAGNVLDPASDPFTSRWNPDSNPGYSRNGELQAMSNSQPPRNAPAGTWGGLNLPYDAQRIYSERSAFGNGRTQPQISTGPQFNPIVTRPSPGPGFGNLPHYPQMAMPPPPAYQAWNNFASSDNRAPTRSLNPLSPSANFGGDWARGFAHLNLGQDDKK